MGTSHSNQVEASLDSDEDPPLKKEAFRRLSEGFQVEKEEIGEFLSQIPNNTNENLLIALLHKPSKIKKPLIPLFVAEFPFFSAFLD